MDEPRHGGLINGERYLVILIKIFFIFVSINLIKELFLFAFLPIYLGYESGKSGYCPEKFSLNQTINREFDVLDQKIENQSTIVQMFVDYRKQQMRYKFNIFEWFYERMSGCDI